MSESDETKRTVRDLGLLDRLPAAALDGTLEPHETISCEPDFGTEPPSSDENVFAARELTLTPEVAELPFLTVAGDDHEAQEVPSSADLRIIDTLGEGGMGVVYLARQASLRREVALKLIKPSKASRKHVGSLLREAVLSGTLEHPNIIPIHGLGRTRDEKPVIVMKRVEGVSWSTLAHETDHPFWGGASVGERLERHVRITMQLCDALAFTHSRGVIHRDIKPENVMLGEYGEVYLLDWGVAASKENLTGPELLTTSIVGTPAYMAPEMLVEGGAITERTDVYLLGASLHEAITGSSRHAGETYLDTLLKANDSEPHEYDESIPTELADICNRACACYPDDRFDGVRSLQEALSSFLEHRASVRLTRAALEELRRLKRLISEGDSTKTISQEDLEKARSLGTNCIFAFKQALNEWSENDLAIQGLQWCLETMISLELDLGHPGAAAMLISDLPSPRPDFAKTVEKLRDRATRDANAMRALEELEYQQDIQVSRRHRHLLIGGTALILSIVASLSAGFDVMTSIEQPFLKMAGLTTLCTLLMAIAGYVWRERLLKTRINRQLSALLFLLFVLLTIHRWLGVLADLPLPQVFVIDALVVGTISATTAVFLQRRFILFSVLMFASALGGTLLPRFSQEFLIAAFIISAGILIIVERSQSWSHYRRDGTENESVEDGASTLGPHR